MAKKILIVEDDKMLSNIFEIYITELGYNLIGNAQSSEKAIEMCEKYKPDIILMDIQIMGENDGIETTKIIGEKFNIPVIYISGDFDKKKIKGAIFQNVYGYLMKPIYKNNLKSTIEFDLQKHKINIQ